MAAAVRIAVGVVAHKTRQEQAEHLGRKVGAVICNVDEGTLGCAGNHLQVLTKLAPTSWMDIFKSWIVILEDDAAPVTEFQFHLKQALALAPAPIVGLYLGTGNPSGQPQRQIAAAMRVAAGHNRAWITADCLIGSVGYAIRGDLIADMLGDVADRDGEFPLRVSRWAQQCGIRICYTVPSLVDHADGDPVGRSTWPARPVRKAWRFGAREDWDTPAVPLGFCNDWSKVEDR